MIDLGDVRFARAKVHSELRKVPTVTGIKGHFGISIPQTSCLNIPRIDALVEYNIER